MELSLFVLALVVVVLLAGVVGWVAHLRVKALKTYAQERGWSYARRNKAQARRDGTPFGTGRSRAAEHVISGVAGGRLFTTFEYRYTTGDQRSSTPTAS